MKKFTSYFICMLFLALPGQAIDTEWLILGGTGAIAGGALAGVWFGMEQPSACKWCQNPNSTNADTDATESFQWDNPQSADLVSNIVGYGIIPAGSLASMVGYSVPEWKKFGHYGLILADAVLLDLFVTTWIKKSIARQRPESFYNYTQTNDESYVSFPSGHTSLAFTLAATSSLIALREQSRSALYIAIPGSILSVFTGYLRIAAIKHWMSDVLVGAGIGSIFGILTPLALFKSFDPA